MLMVPQYYPKRELLRVILLPCPCMPLPSSLSSTMQIMTLIKSGMPDDVTATGKITNLCTWWDKLVSLGPAYGYHVNASKTCLVAKQSHHAAALSAFHDTQITIIAEGKPHLGAARIRHLHLCTTLCKEKG